jgi:hypothetical protein
VGWEVDLTEQAKAFVQCLDEDDKVRVVAAMKVLAEQGPDLGRPLVDVIKGSRHKNMKELRISSGQKKFRVLFAFDAERHAILLVGGDKIAYGVQKFYDDMVPVADQLFDDHITTRAKIKQPAPTKGASKGNKSRRPT